MMYRKIPFSVKFYVPFICAEFIRKFQCRARVEPNMSSRPLKLTQLADLWVHGWFVFVYPLPFLFYELFSNKDSN